MVPKLSILFFLCFLRAVHMEQRNSRKVSGADVILGALLPDLTLDYCLSIVQEHWLLDILEAVKTLNESIASLSRIKQEIIDEVKIQLTQTQNVTLTENENLISDSQGAILEQLAIEKEAIITSISSNNAINQEIIVDDIKSQLAQTQVTILTENQQCVSKSERTILDQLTIEKDAIIAENDNVISSVETIVKDELAAVEETLTDEINEIKTQQDLNTEAIADIQLRNPLPRDCRDVQARGAKSSGEYRIKPRAATSDFVVYCDLDFAGGPWVYVINRIDGLQDFYLGWDEYKLGFGNLLGEHWLGLDHLYELTNSESHELLFEIVDENQKSLLALYDEFKIGPESDGYPILTLGTYKGTAGDGFSDQQGMQFTTKDFDRDHDEEPSGNCARQNAGAWWYKDCGKSNLSGTLKTGAVDTIFWNDISRIEEARMMIRPKSS